MLTHTVLVPIQMKPVVSSLLPEEHSQMKEPAMFLHTLLTQGLLSHSFKSVNKERDVVGGYERISLKMSRKRSTPVGQWRDLSLNPTQALYRMSCPVQTQTLSEINNTLINATNKIK